MSVSTLCLSMFHLYVSPLKFVIQLIIPISCQHCHYEYYFHLFIHLFSGAHSGACSVSFPGLLAKLVNK